MRILRWLSALWHAHQRAIDLEVLWPSCLRLSHGDPEHARAAFAFHAFSDQAWLCLGEAEITRIIDGLF